MKTVRDFLDENKGKWFSVNELMDKLGFQEMSVRNALYISRREHPELYEKATLNGRRVWRRKDNEPTFARVEYFPEGENNP